MSTADSSAIALLDSIDPVLISISCGALACLIFPILQFRKHSLAETTGRIPKQKHSTITVEVCSTHCFTVQVRQLAEILPLGSVWGPIVLSRAVKDLTTAGIVVGKHRKLPDTRDLRLLCANNRKRLQYDSITDTISLRTAPGNAIALRTPQNREMLC